jgi:hypothetical protein
MKKILAALLLVTTAYGQTVQVDRQTTTATDLNLYVQDQGEIGIEFREGRNPVSLSGDIVFWWGTNALRSAAVVSITNTIATPATSFSLPYTASDFSLESPGRQAWTYGVEVDGKMLGDGRLYVKHRPGITNAVPTFLTRYLWDFTQITDYISVSEYGPYLWGAGFEYTTNSVGQLLITSLATQPTFTNLGGDPYDNAALSNALMSADSPDWTAIQNIPAAITNFAEAMDQGVATTDTPAFPDVTIDGTGVLARISASVFTPTDLETDYPTAHGELTNATALAEGAVQDIINGGTSGTTGNVERVGSTITITFPEPGEGGGTGAVSSVTGAGYVETDTTTGDVTVSLTAAATNLLEGAVQTNHTGDVVITGDFMVGVDTNVMVVSGFGVSSANGVYGLSGLDQYGFPEYTNADGHRLRLLDEPNYNWALFGSGGGGNVLYSQPAEDPFVEYPHLVTSWNVVTGGGGVAPAGTVTAGPTLSSIGTNVRVHTDLQVDGSITANSFHGGGAGLTDLPATLLTYNGTNITEAALDTSDFGWDGTNLTSTAAGGDTSAAKHLPHFINAGAGTVNVSALYNSQHVTNIVGSVTNVWPEFDAAFAYDILLTIPPTTNQFAWGNTNRVTYTFIPPLSADYARSTNRYTRAVLANSWGTTNAAVTIAEGELP